MEAEYISAVDKEMKKQMKIYYCQIVKLAILGLMVFSLLGCQKSDDEVAEKRSRARNTPESNSTVAQANSLNTQSPPSGDTNAASPTSPISNATSPTSPVSNTQSPPSPPTAKPVDCDKKCYTVYDQCTAEFRQFPDVEKICKGKQTTCLRGCSSSAPQSASQPKHKAKTNDGVGKCDDKCFKAKDQCEADFRQFPDVEEICNKKMVTCLGKCP